MKTTFTSLLLFSLIQFNVFACTVRSNAGIPFEIRKVGKFSAIELRNSVNVFITQGDLQELKIESEGKDIRRITTVIKNDKLIIGSEKELKSKEHVNIYITVKDLTLIQLSGSGNISMTGVVKFPRLEIQLSGSGNILALVDSKFLKMILSGSGNLDVKGRTAESEINNCGSGNLNGKELTTFTSSILASGSGTSTVDVTNELNINITGSGNVFYLTDPEKMIARSYGSGKVEKIS